MADDLSWSVKSEEKLLDTRVFDIYSKKSESETGITGDYVTIKAPNWVNVIAEYEGNFIMVRQYRHGLGNITMEFPGGIADKTGESIEETAKRELYEETGFIAEKIVNVGAFNPNPALFENTVTFCVAEGLTPTETQHLDDDEVLKYYKIPVNDVIKSIGTGEYCHAFMGTAILMYLKYKGLEICSE